MAEVKPAVTVSDEARRWELTYLLVKAYIEEIGKFPAESTIYEGVHIGRWFAYQREMANIGLLMSEHSRKIDALDILVAELTPHEGVFGTLLPPKRQLIKHPRKGYVGSKPKEPKPAKGKSMSSVPMDVFAERVEATNKFWNENGRLPRKSEKHIRAAGTILINWVWDLPKLDRDGRLTDEHRKLLEGAPWWQRDTKTAPKTLSDAQGSAPEHVQPEPKTVEDAPETAAEPPTPPTAVTPTPVEKRTAHERSELATKAREERESKEEAERKNPTLENLPEVALVRVKNTNDPGAAITYRVRVSRVLDSLDSISKAVEYLSRHNFDVTVVPSELHGLSGPSRWKLSTVVVTNKLDSTLKNLDTVGYTLTSING